jgi:DNA-binding MarR family transcriptional regulator
MMRNQPKVAPAVKVTKAPPRKTPTAKTAALKLAAVSRANTASQPMATSVGYLVRQAHQAFTRSLELRLSPHDISPSMYFFLRLLWEQDGLTQREISERLGLTPPTTVSAMDNLESKGLILRNRSTTDRRQIHIFLTKRGKDLEGKLRPRTAEVNAVALQSVSPAEADMLCDLMNRMMRSLDLDAGSS